MNLRVIIFDKINRCVVFIEWIKLMQGYDFELWNCKLLQVYGMCLRLFRAPKLQILLPVLQAAKASKLALGRIFLSNRNAALIATEHLTHEEEEEIRVVSAYLGERERCCMPVYKTLQNKMLRSWLHTRPAHETPKLPGNHWNHENTAVLSLWQHGASSPERV